VILNENEYPSAAYRKDALPTKRSGRHCRGEQGLDLREDPGRLPAGKAIERSNGADSQGRSDEVHRAKWRQSAPSEVNGCQVAQCDSSAAERAQARGLTLAGLDIRDVWRALGGAQLRGKRGRAFWREGDGYNITVDHAKGFFYDHRDGRGGGILDLVELALGIDRRDAICFLERRCGLEGRRRSHAEWQRDCEDRQAAEWWARCAEALAWLELENLDSCDRQREGLTTLLMVTRSGSTSTLAEYREWRAKDPTLAQAMVRAGQTSDARRQSALAVFIRELSAE
jgi:hypothetical protein